MKDEIHICILIYFYKRAHSTEASTQPYIASTTPAPETNKPNYYSYYQKKNDYTTTTKPNNVNPYNYYSYTTKQTEQLEKSTETSISTHQPTSKFSTTKNPYDFNDFDTKAPKLETKRVHQNKDETDYFGRSTTKSPFPDKGIKSVFKIGTYYSQAKSSDNSIRPDANSQQVQIEPARLVFSYHRNLTSGKIIRT